MKSEVVAVLKEIWLAFVICAGLLYWLYKPEPVTHVITMEPEYIFSDKCAGEP